MDICVIVAFFCGLFLVLLRRESGKQIKRKMCMVLFVSALLAKLYAVSSGDKTAASEGTIVESLEAAEKLQRLEPGEGSYDTSWILNVPGVLEDYEIEIEVPQQRLSKQEEEAYLSSAIKEIDETFPGENKSVESIRENPYVSGTYQNGMVEAEWSFSDYDYINSSGELTTEDLSEEGCYVMATVNLTCEDSSCIYEFYLCLLPRIKEAEEKFLDDLMVDLEEKELQEEAYLCLPEQIGEYNISWSEKEDLTYLKILFLGVIIAFCVPMIAQSRQKEEEKIRREKLALAYPTVVNKLMLLLGAGMTLQGAWKKILSVYNEKSGESNVLYDEMLVTLHEIESGKGEALAYEDFGKRCGLPNYRRFGNLLSQNLKKGAGELENLLEQEALQAREERRNNAKKLGEEAGTKLLMPMIIMFGIVIAVIIVPAFLSFQLG